MPNHCENNLTITGPSLDKFMEAITKYDPDKEEDTYSILGTQFPCPEELANASSRIAIEYKDRNTDKELFVLQQSNITKYGTKDWYNWCIENWGTKWGDYDNRLLDNGSISFLSAWGPPIEGLQKVSQKWPELAFRLEYFEPGMCFCGTTTFLNGRVENEIYQEFATINCKICGSELFALGYYDKALEFECSGCYEILEIPLEELDETS